MTVVNPNYEYVVQENKVYQIKPIFFTNVPPHLQITGSGSVNLFASIQIPTSLDDPILTLNPTDTKLFGFKQFKPGTPNFIKFVENEAGSRVITLSGFYQPVEVIFS